MRRRPAQALVRCLTLELVPISPYLYSGSLALRNSSVQRRIRKPPIVPFRIGTWGENRCLSPAMEQRTSACAGTAHGVQRTSACAGSRGCGLAWASPGASPAHALQRRRWCAAWRWSVGSCAAVPGRRGHRSSACAGAAHGVQLQSRKKKRREHRALPGAGARGTTPAGASTGGPAAARAGATPGCSGASSAHAASYGPHVRCALPGAGGTARSSNAVHPPPHLRLR